MVRVNYFLSVLFICCFSFAGAQKVLPAGTWQAQLGRTDGNNIPFILETGTRNGKQVAWLRNAKERILIDDIRFAGDSVIFKLPFFEAELRTVRQSNHVLTGIYTKHLENDYLVMPFFADFNRKNRFASAGSAKNIQISGRYRVVFGKPEQDDSSYSVGEFQQVGNHVTGTFLNTDGDYRYLDGVISGDTLKLSCFDGGHAYYFTAKIASDKELIDGKRYSGPEFTEDWKAERNAAIKLPDEFSLTKMKPGESKFHFTFKDTDGKTVSLNDARFKNKVVILQIMGSWCPNCMDETGFLSGFYKEYKNKGLEIIGLAYERSEDFNRSQKSLRSFQSRFHVEYPVLITGVTVNDEKRTEKTLPQLEKIIAFPSTIFIGRNGEVQKIHTGFKGPGTGTHYEEEKKLITKTVNELLGESVHAK